LITPHIMRRMKFKTLLTGSVIALATALPYAAQSTLDPNINDRIRKEEADNSQVMKTLHSSPGLEDLWQVHFSQLSGQEYTVAGLFIANVLDEPSAAMPVAPIAPPPPGPGAPAAPLHNGTAYWIKVSAQADGSFSVTNARNGFSKTYKSLRPGSS